MMGVVAGIFRGIQWGGDEVEDVVGGRRRM